MITEENITQAQEEDNIKDINSRTLGSLQEEAFDMSNKHSTPISNPIDLSNIYSNETYTNGQQYLSPDHSDSRSPCLGLSPEHTYSDSCPPCLGISPAHRDSPAYYLDLLPEHGHSGPAYGSIFQPTVEDPDEDLKDTEDSESNPELTNGVVIFEPDAEPDTDNESEYHFKNSPLHIVEEARRLDYARCVDDLGNFILE